MGDPSLAAFASWRLDGVSNTALRREWEAAAPDVEESREPTVAVDEHGVVIEQLPRGTSSGFFLDAPAMRKVGSSPPSSRGVGCSMGRSCELLSSLDPSIASLHSCCEQPCRTPRGLEG